MPPPGGGRVQEGEPLLHCLYPTTGVAVGMGMVDLRSRDRGGRVQEGEPLLHCLYPTTGVAVGMGMVDLDEIIETGCLLLGEGGYRKVNPYFIVYILPQVLL